MRNPFKRFRSAPEKDAPPAPEQAQALPPEPAPEPEPEMPHNDAKEAPADPFIEWRRTKVQGGIERRERNDIFEAYSVYGTDDQGRLICRFYHRYPEHERDFDLSYSRVLSFCDFNKRLLAELDKYSITLQDYHACIAAAQELLHEAPPFDPYMGFSAEEEEALRAFCDGMDNLIDKEYLHADGLFRCSCRSAVGDEKLALWFRQPLSFDAADTDVAGVGRQPVESYDIDNLWIMGVCNRLRDNCSACSVTLLTSQWSLSHESVYLMTIEGFRDVSGTLLLAVAPSDAFAHFGFYSLDFARK